MSICAISTGPSTHLDHLAPLCSQLGALLIVTDPDHEELSQTFYPMVKSKYVPLQELHLDFLASWDAIMTCGKFWAMELGPALRLVKGARVRFIFCPHGHSDKEEFLNYPIEQDIHLVYGPQKEALPNTFEIGNVRHAFYHQYKDHFDQLAAPFFLTDQRTVLYAPTWESRSTSTSFFNHIDEVVSLLAKDYHLLVKLHPLLEENNPALYHRAIGKYGSQVTFIEHFPPVFPLLEKSDIYLGDHSSIGYDFLIYDRPLFFLSDKGALMNCGRPFSGTLENPQTDLSDERKKTWKRVFGSDGGQYHHIAQLIQRGNATTRF